MFKSFGKSVSKSNLTFNQIFYTDFHTNHPIFSLSAVIIRNKKKEFSLEKNKVGQRVKLLLIFFSAPLKRYWYYDLAK